MVSIKSPAMTDFHQEEADSRLVVHVQHALQHGGTSIQVRSSDIAVIVILVGMFKKLVDVNANINLWVTFGTGRHFTVHHINAIVQHLGVRVSQALPVFHSFTGCDTTSSFFKKGKKSAWSAWRASPYITDTFVDLAEHPFQVLSVESENFKNLERFTVNMYARTSPLTSVNDARKELFCPQSQAMECLPPTQVLLINDERHMLVYIIYNAQNYRPSITYVCIK